MDVRRAVAALVLLGLLVGCAKDEPRADPPEPTASVSTPPTPPEPAIPDAAKGADEAGARAFVHFWFRLFNYSINTGDSAALMRSSSGDCVTCNAFRRNIRKAHADGGGVRAVGWKPIAIGRVRAAGLTTFDMTVRQGDEEYLNADGEVLQHFAGRTREMTIRLTRRDSAWVVQQLDIKR
jgi:hypothetical protein